VYACTQMYLHTILDLSIHSKSMVPNVIYADPRGTRDHFTVDPWIYFCNDNFEV